MGHLAATEAERHLDLVPLLEEPHDRAHLDFVVVVIDARPELDLLDFDDLLALARLGRLFLLEEAVLPEIEDLANRRRGVGDDLDQVEPGLLSLALRVGEIDHPLILALGIDKLDLDCPNIAVRSRAAFLRRRGSFHRTANGPLLGSLAAPARAQLRFRSEPGALRIARNGSEHARSQLRQAGRGRSPPGRSLMSGAKVCRARWTDPRRCCDSRLTTSLAAGPAASRRDADGEQFPTLLDVVRGLRDAGPRGADEPAVRPAGRPALAGRLGAAGRRARDRADGAGARRPARRRSRRGRRAHRDGRARRLRGRGPIRRRCAPRSSTASSCRRAASSGGCVSRPAAIPRSSGRRRTAAF